MCLISAHNRVCVCVCYYSCLACVDNFAELTGKHKDPVDLFSGRKLIIYTVPVLNLLAT